MTAPRPSSLWSDELAHEVRTALTLVKAHAQLLSRVVWPTTVEQHETLQTRVAAIDHAATLAVRHLNRLLAEHARQWPDDAATPGAEAPSVNHEPEQPLGGSHDGVTI